MTVEHFDVLIVGAGLSGIGAAHHLQRRCPGKRYAILEARERIGGTWDLFRYPGIRSDSDMFTLGYAFRPWTAAKAIADGPDILRYVNDTAREGGIDRHIRFQHRVKKAEWSSERARWTVEIERGSGHEPLRMSCDFLYLCSGYYSYAGGYAPAFAGAEDFRGRIVHPQAWPQDLDYRGKRVVVIGSGATAVTLVPAMSDQAAHVTMLQRSPTYVLSLPARDAIGNALRRVLPAKLAYALTRWKNVLLSQFFYQLCRRAPEVAKRLLRKGVAAQLPSDFAVDTHFKPRYNPWDQRVCFVPDNDLFTAINQGRASIVTDQVERFTESGIRLQSGAELPADIVVTATGLQMLALGGAQFVVDGEPVDLARTMSYKGMMLSGMPNLAYCVGYTNASWTLKADLASTYVCRLLNYMERHGYRRCVARNTDPGVRAEPLIDFSSGYVQRSIDQFPRQGSKAPWKLYQNYVLDLLMLKYGRIPEDALHFSGDTAATDALTAGTG